MIARFQAWKSILGNRCRQVITDLFRKGQEIGGHDGADRMNARVMGPGLAASIAEKAGHWIERTGLQFPAQNITGVCIVSAGHGSAPAKPCNLALALGLDVMRPANVNLALLV